MKHNILQKLNQLIPWSSIAGIGNSAPARLTALVPLVGYLIIYNKIIADFFFLSINSITESVGPASILDLFRSLKLTFLYFGLLLFGMGAIIFALSAPSRIRRYKTPEEYVLGMEAAQTEWLIVDSLTRVGRSAWREDCFNDAENYGITSLSFTEDTLYQLDAILEHAGRNAFLADSEADNSNRPDPFYNALGNVMTDRVLECILAKRRAEHALWHNAVGIIVETRARDVFYMAYTFDEWSKFSTRLVCSSMFFFGTIFLIVPTAITTWEVILQIGN